MGLTYAIVKHCAISFLRLWILLKLQTCDIEKKVLSKTKDQVLWQKFSDSILCSDNNGWWFEPKCVLGAGADYGFDACSVS